MNGDLTRVHADRSLRERLARLVPRDAVAAEAPEREAADSLLARIAWSRLVEPGDAVAGALIEAVGARTALELLVSGADAADIAQAMPSEESAKTDRAALAAGLKRWRPRIDQAETRNDIERAVARRVGVVTPESPHWATGLADLGAHAPLLLWTLGDPSLLARFSLAVVGARACTGYGTHVTAELCDAACASGIVIVSGAAYGVDAVAHRTALAMKTPTIAVLAGGVDRPYPLSHEKLLSHISQSGLVCSEMVPGSAPTRWRFLQRNRNIAALARAVLVTEAGVRSGSLNTAGHAAELGRPIGAVPGPITSTASAGCHRLIREYDATLVTSGAELREFLGLDEMSGLIDREASDDAHSKGDAPPSAARQPALHRRVLDALPLRGGRSADDTARRAGVALDDAAGALAELELLGYVSRRETPDGGEQWVLQRRE